MEDFRLGIENLENRTVLTPVVAVIDSGIDLNHQSLKSYIWNNPKEIVNNGLDDDGNGFIDDIYGWNFVDQNNNVQDGYGHGTHVAGIVASYGPVSILALKFFDDKGIGYTGDAIKAINYAIMMKKNYGIDIVAINSSWVGSTGYSSLLEDAIKRANEANIVFVTSAGNTGSNHDITPKYPSSYNQTNIISVAALDFEGKYLAGYSDYGKNSVSIAAIGTSVFSTLPNNTYGYLSGTSMAAPQITGAIVAICNKYGDLNVEQIKAKIFSTVNKLDTLIDKVIVGGSLNINRALDNHTFKTQVPSNPTSSVSIVTKNWNERIFSRINQVSMNRIRGWIIDKDNLDHKVFIKIFINNNIVWSGEANKYRPDLKRYYDKYHGFDVRLGRSFFKRGWNTLNIIAENTVNGESKIILTRHIKRII